MTHVIRIAKQGFNVLNINGDRSEESLNKITPSHFLSVLALPYLLGAKTQVKRYLFATLTLRKNSVFGVYECLHEISTLFEDLCTVAKYIEKSGNKNKLHQLWFDVRNHIRHDFREELDNENNQRKNERAIKLKLNPRFQVDIEFSGDSVTVGNIIIEIKQVSGYLNWADNIIATILEDAKNKGYIKR